MRRRGWILIVAAVLGMAAITAALAPSPREGEDDEPPAPRPQPRGGGDALELDFNATSPAVEEVARGTHVVIRVQAPSPAQVAVPRLGLTGYAEPRAPAVFDILADRTGRFDITFAPPGEEPRRAGTLVVR